MIKVPLSQVVDIKYLLSAEEYEAVMKIRAEKAKDEAIQKNKEYLEEIVMSIINAIGLEETKRIIRDINRNLRRCSEEPSF